MIERIEFKNYKALRSAVLPLGQLTLIVGPNGSGKTTAIEAVSCVSNFKKLTHADVATADSPEDDVGVTFVWGQPDVGSRIQLTWRPGEKLIQRLEPGGLQSQVSQQVLNSILDPRSHTHRSTAHVSAADPATSQIEFLRDSRVYNFDASSIANPVKLAPMMELARDGTGLAGVLDRLRDASPERFEALTAELPHWFGEYDRVLFETPADGMRAIILRTRNGSRIPAKQCSQGTLLALAMLTISYLPEPPPLVAFEEPDRGLHPRILNEVRDAMYRLSHPGSFGDDRPPVQVIATTHSPFLLDLFKEHLDEIVIAQKNGTDGAFERLSDHADVDQILEGASLGDVWYSGILGGVPIAP